VTIFGLSAAVLGLAANFAKLFLPSIQHDFTIFSLVVPSLTILVYLLLLQWAQPRLEVTAHFVVGVLWLAMGAWAADIIGYVQCYPLGGQTTPTNNGTMSSRTYCYEMKVIEALSWFLFVLLAIYFIIIITLTTRAVVLGRYFAWREHISQLGWFGELPGYPTESVYPRPYAGYGAYGQPYPMMQPNMMHNPMGGYVVQQAHGHSVVIQPGVNGQPTTVNQVPSMG